MKLYLCGHDDRYAIEQLQLVLFPEETMEPVDAPFDGDGAVSKLSQGKTWLTATACITLGGKTARALRRMRLENADIPSRRMLLQNAYYDAAMQHRAPPDWGSLSGVRPSKLTTKYMLSGLTAAQAQRRLEQTYHVTSERSRLCAQCSSATLAAAQRMEKQDVSVYIGIPFCPTRCAYCSFVTAGIEKAGKFLSPFLDCLEKEIEHVGKLLKASNKRIRTLYIGGGTPTTLNNAQMRRLMQAISTHFDLTSLIEYTVEGGRPDTLDLEKLKTIRSLGCDRMSINPQTMNDAILQAIGRCHTSEQTEKAFFNAKKAGFEGINMDLIAGLTGEDEVSFARSLDRVLALQPSNITVHTLALKKGADLYYARMGLPTAEQVRAMLDYAQAALTAHGYRPYYLYRQKYMSGSFENIGWCRSGFEGLYNIYMMEEMHSIISLGGGAMTKINLPDGRLERFHNPKFPQQYIERIEDVLRRKTEAFALL